MTRTKGAESSTRADHLNFEEVMEMEGEEDICLGLASTSSVVEMKLVMRSRETRARINAVKRYVEETEGTEDEDQPNADQRKGRRDALTAFRRRENKLMDVNAVEAVRVWRPMKT